MLVKVSAGLKCIGPAGFPSRYKAILLKLKTKQLIFFLSVFHALITFVLFESAWASESYLLKSLAHQGIQLPETSDYQEIVRYLSEIEEKLNSKVKKQIITYFNHDTINNIIKIETSKPGILKWYIEKAIVLPKGLLFIEYSDGEINGGSLLLKAKYRSNKVISTVTLWDSHKEIDL